MKMMSLDHDIELWCLLTGEIMYNIWQLQRELQQDGHSTSMCFYEHFKGIVQQPCRSWADPYNYVKILQKLWVQMTI